MKIALHNHHLQPNFKYHPYIQSLIESDEVKGVFISDRSIINLLKTFKNKKISKLLTETKENNLEIIFDIDKLNSDYDVLIDLNFFTNTLEAALPKSLKKFNGIKLFHIGDYFGYHQASQIHSKLKDIGVTALFGYCMHDRYCKFFREFYPSYIDKVWGIPFGYSDRFEMQKKFDLRKDMAISVGSLNQLSNDRFKKSMFFEAINFFKNEKWFHRFREKLFINRNELRDSIMCGIPDPYSKNNKRLDLVNAFNEHKFFVTCETIFNFPTAKVYEGTASGSVLLASQHPVYSEFGFSNDKNCILFEYENIDDLVDKIYFYTHENSMLLNQIANNSYNFTLKNFNANKISAHIINICKKYVKNINIKPEPYINHLN